MAPTYADVCHAAQCLNGIVKQTPVLTSKFFSDFTGIELYFKCENFQLGGAFKYRGAYYSLMQLSQVERRAGVLTFSSGNHAQALARAGRELDINVTVIMPNDAPKVKKDATIGYGAEVILYDPSEESREALGRKICEERGLIIIPPYDYANTIAGAGTVAKELHESVPDLDALLVPCGGGGLLAGSFLSTKALNENCRIFGVEPLAGNDGGQSFEKGSIVSIPVPHTIADGARTPSLGVMNFQIIKENVSGFFDVSDQELFDAMLLTWERMKIVVEPTGALAIAAAIRNSKTFRGRKVGVIISGGNVDVRAIQKLQEVIN